MTDNPIDAFLDALTTASITDADVYADDAVLDATVPNWRLQRHGPDAIKAEYAAWFNAPVTFVQLERIPVPDGEVVTYEHEWVEDGVRHRGHHAHHLTIAGGRIAADTVWCGGRWPEPLLRDMAAERSPLAEVDVS